MHSMENRPRVKGPLRRGLTPPPLTRKTFGEPALWHLTRSIHISGVRQTDCILFSLARARVTFARMSEALAVQMNGFGDWL